MGLHEHVAGRIFSLVELIFAVLCSKISDTLHASVFCWLHQPF